MLLKDRFTGDLESPADFGAVASPETPAAPPRWRRRLVLATECLGLLFALGVAGLLRLWNLQQNGWGTTYYTAAVRSGMESWHNFFYLAFDPGGYVSVDKPPVALWVQVLSAKLFGFNQLSVLLPQAIMGILSVLILWHLVRRRFAALAGFLAALALAVTPISVAVERTNNTDACLAFLLLLSGWALIRATEKGSLWLLLLSMFLVGVAFNTKMLAAFVVLPTYYLVYLLGTPVSWRSRLGDLALASFVLFSVSLSWAVLYDLTPEDDRPYADSTQNNSMLTLIVQHNGVERFVRRGRGRPARATGAAAGAGRPAGPQDGPAGPPGPGPGTAGPPFAGPGFAGGASFGPGGVRGGPAGRGGPGGRGGVGWGGGAPVGIWRLAHPHMAGQVLWFLPLALLGLLVAVFQKSGVLLSLPKEKPRSWALRPEHQDILLWVGWLATYYVVYSFAGGIFHDYYVLTMAAPMAALTGIGGAALWNCFQAKKGSVPLSKWRSLLLPLAILLTAAWQALIWLNYPELAKYTVPALFIMAIAGGLGLLAFRGSWWAPVLTLVLLACIGWLWSRDSAAPDVLAVAAGQLDQARTALRGMEGWDSFKKLYTKFSPDIGTLLPDLHRQAPLISPSLLWGCGIAAGCLLLIFALAKRLGRARPILAKGAVIAAAVCFLALYVGPGVWALSPLWGTGGMLPAADVSLLTRTIREREQRAQETARVAREAARITGLAVAADSGATSPALAAAPAILVASDLAVFLRGGPRGGRPAFARGGPGGRGRQAGAFAPPFPGGFPGPGTPPRDTEASRQERHKFVEFLKANHDGERWVLAVSSSQQASLYIIEDDLSVMPINGFGGAATLGTESDEIKARLTKLVEEGQVRFFQVGPGRGGVGRGRGAFGPPGAAGGNRAPAPPGGGPFAGGPPGGFGRGGAVVSQWIQEQVEKGKAKRVDPRLYRSEESPQANRGQRRGRGFGMMGGSGDLYDLRPELGLRESLIKR
jgi:4-amino-4-deoxy-L-arabinose transferase-like glycosyltransferase